MNWLGRRAIENSHAGGMLLVRLRRRCAIGAKEYCQKAKMALKHSRYGSLPGRAQHLLGLARVFWNALSV